MIFSAVSAENTSFYAKINMHKFMSQLNNRIHTLPVYGWDFCVSLFSLGNCDRRILT